MKHDLKELGLDRGAARRRRKVVLVGALVAAAVAACGGGGGGGGGFNFAGSGGSPPPAVATPPAPAATLNCDSSIQTGFKPDANTSVLLVKAFKKGEPLVLSETPTPTTGRAENDLCLVKLLVGPGNPGPAGAPSTSAGIGIEVWLPTPSNWNKRLRMVGGAGWGGSMEASTTALSAGSYSNDLLPAPLIAGVEGAVSASFDTGHQGGPFDGSFAMNPDGSINETLWNDFASRSIHETALKSKALAQAYYGAAPKYSYFTGGSTGGRQAMKAAQAHPQDFDGIIAGFPAINWSKFITAELYPQIVFQQDLGGVPLTTTQQDLVSNAAIKSCDLVGGVHLGYILDPSKCSYDPATDVSVLCPVSGGTSTSPNCVTTVQAQVMNKMWYGMTADGSVPLPASDNGLGLTPSGAQRWYGVTRGTTTSLLQGLPAPALGNPDVPFGVAPPQVALELQNPTMADPAFINATGNGANGWRSLSYAQLSNAFDRGVALQGSFGNINTDEPDLSSFKNRGGKLIMYHGLNDEVIPSQGSVNYYNRVIGQMGGLAGVQSFYKLYMIPGMGHGSPNGTANPSAKPPIPAPGQMYQKLTDWVEQAVTPDRVELSNMDNSISQPICPYPKKASYQSGNPLVAASYGCD